MVAPGMVALAVGVGLALVYFLYQRSSQTEQPAAHTNSSASAPPAASSCNRRPRKAFNSDQECIICMSPLRESNCTKLQCSHIFHISCIRTWCNRGNSTCPVCRATVETL